MSQALITTAAGLLVAAAYAAQDALEADPSIENAVLCHIAEQAALEGNTK